MQGWPGPVATELESGCGPVGFILAPVLAGGAREVEGEPEEEEFCLSTCGLELGGVWE